MEEKKYKPSELKLMIAESLKDLLAKANKIDISGDEIVTIICENDLYKMVYSRKY